MDEILINSRKKEELIEITQRVQDLVSENVLDNGLINIFVPHTTAGIMINENADPDVAWDIIYGFQKIVPENGYAHLEGNSAAHIKSALTGISLTVMVENGRLVLGTWQGIYFCEFDGPRQRKIYTKIITA